MDAIFDEAEAMPPWRGHFMTGRVTALSLPDITALDEETIVVNGKTSDV